jgi:two-component system, NtrC family, sensor kinase
VRTVPVSKLFLILLATTFLIVVLSSIFFTYNFAEFSAEGSRRSQNLQETAILNLELRQLLNEQIRCVYQQLEKVETDFPERFSQINFELGEKQTRYLKLHLGVEERLTVERIKELQAELGLEALRIYNDLRTEDRDAAVLRLAKLKNLENKINTEFLSLNQLETDKLSVVQDQLAVTASNTHRAIYGLAAYLLTSLLVFTILLRRRVLQPLKQILMATNRVRQGDFSARAPETQADELGELSRSFNFMAASLAESYAGLEKKVAERTLQLEQLQQQLVQSEKMSAVGRMLSGVAHELNNPLAIILGKIELAKRRLLASRNNHEQLRMMEDLHEQGERCKKIVANLLQFARQGKPRLETVRLNDVIEQALQLREHELMFRNVTIMREFDVTNPKVCVDPNKIVQVVLNLLNNADDAINEARRPGTIRVKTAIAGDNVRIEIIDSGTGLREPERVFDPFYTTKEVGQGTGLGLSVCYGIIEEHKGSIRAENSEAGAHFTISLPIGDIQAEPEIEEEPEDEPATVERQRGLVVDDEVPLVNLQIDFLSDIGVDAVGVNSGQEAIDYLKSNEVDVVISDVRMPGAVDGIQLYQWINSNRPALSERFIFVSGDMIGMKCGEFFLNSTARRIQKPFLWDEYSNLVKDAIGNREGTL